VQRLPELMSAFPRANGNRNRGAASPLAAGLATAAITAALATSCAHSTSGTAATQHTPPQATTGASAGPHPSATAAPTPAAPVVSDEDQAKQSVTDFQNAYNSQNWEAYTELMCAAMRSQFTGVIMDSVKKGRAQNGPVVIKAVTVRISGDDATATINGASEGLGPGSIDLPLKREDGWKVCQIR
jgi:predicted lipid-binding transport protein (Tim44 family)